MRGGAMRRRRLLRYVVVLLLVAAALALSYWVGRQWEQGAAERAAGRGDLAGRFEGRRAIEYRGATYRYRERLTTLLVMGVDRPSGVSAGLGARNGGQADLLLLLVADPDRGRLTPIQLDRDTMATIEVLDVLGRPVGTRTAQLCLAHAFGDGGAQSCEFAARAVGRLLLGVDVDGYLAFDLGAIAAINDAAGGVTVSIEDDFTAFDRAMTRGATLTLVGRQAEAFTRWRMGVGDGTNAARMRRQRAYLVGLTDALRRQAAEDAGAAGAFFDQVKGHLITDLSRGRLINEIDRMARLEQGEIVSPAGVHIVGDDGFME
ncbi:MAG: hypothetical protein GX558_07065, partial [Clostridiales bacterium]|nr:hypothetical protein [Clostridiales bacterium]